MPTNEPELSRTREVKLPSHPSGWRCGECRAYLKSMEYTAYILPDGTAIPESIARSQIPIGVLGTCKTTLESVCTFFPRWERVAAHHWCLQFPIAMGLK